jgi:hypothetical protein
MVDLGVNWQIILKHIQGDPKVAIHFHEFINLFFFVCFSLIRLTVESWEQCLEIAGRGQIT